MVWAKRMIAILGFIPVRVGSVETQPRRASVRHDGQRNDVAERGYGFWRVVRLWRVRAQE
jgi:hypothetical protein